jgi:hypothetical protein
VAHVLPLPLNVSSSNNRRPSARRAWRQAMDAAADPTSDAQSWSICAVPLGVGLAVTPASGSLVENRCMENSTIPATATSRRPFMVHLLL